MKNFITILLLLSLFTFKNATSQVVIKQLEDLADKVRLLKSRPSGQQKTNTGIEGTPYLSEDFKLGEVYTKDSVMYKGPLRFNTYANEIEFIADDIVYWIAEPQKVIHAKIEKSTFVYIQMIKVHTMNFLLMVNVNYFLSETLNFWKLNLLNLTLMRNLPDSK